MSCLIESNCQNGKTVATDMYHHYPLKFMPVDPMSDKGEALWIYVHGYGGEMVSGEVVDIQVTARTDSKLVLTGQSSTKVYKKNKHISI